jgi:hypothetical protein
MLTLWVVGIQYFVVGLFDFHRARAPDRLLDIGKLFASNAWLFGCDISGSRHGRRAATCARIAATFVGSDHARVPRGVVARRLVRAPSKVASDYYRFQLLTGCRGVEICGHKLHEYPSIRLGDVDHRALPSTRYPGLCPPSG